MQGTAQELGSGEVPMRTLIVTGAEPWIMEKVHKGGKEQEGPQSQGLGMSKGPEEGSARNACKQATSLTKESPFLRNVVDSRKVCLWG